MVFSVWDWADQVRLGKGLGVSQKYPQVQESHFQSSRGWGCVNTLETVWDKQVVPVHINDTRVRGVAAAGP